MQTLIGSVQMVLSNPVDDRRQWQLPSHVVEMSTMSRVAARMPSHWAVGVSATDGNRSSTGTINVNIEDDSSYVGSQHQAAALAAQNTNR